MKSLKSNFSRRLLFTVLAVCYCLSMRAADLLVTSPSADSISTNDSLQTFTTQKVSEYEQNVHRYRTFWSRLIPTQFKFQYAGSIGIFSAAAGWHYGRHQRTWESDIFFGIVPKFQTRCAKTTLTFKQTYIPFRIPLVRQFDFEPLACGMFLSTIFGEEFWGAQPSKYPKHYYGFSTKFRTNVFLGERIRYLIPSQFRKRHNSISAYYELSTSDLYLVSYATNHYLSLWDILSLSFGLKFELF